MAGPKSKASLSVVPAPQLDKRLSAPSTFNERQRQLWKAVVDSKSADWFGADNAPLLAAYVKAVDSHERLSQEVERFDLDRLADMDGVKLLDRLQAMQERQARLMQSMATKMRLTQQSKFRETTAAVKSRSGGARPWD